jgi:hypothetical protein
VNPFEQWLEIGLVVLIAWGDLKGERHLGVCAARGVHPVPEDEAPLASAHPCVGVASPGPIVMATLAVGLDMGAVYSHDLSLHYSRFEEPS